VATSARSPRDAAAPRRTARGRDHGLRADGESGTPLMPEIDPDKTAHHLRIIDRVFHRRVRQIGRPETGSLAVTASSASLSLCFRWSERPDEGRQKLPHSHANDKRSKPTQRRTAEPSPFKSHRRSEVAASRAWLESLPRLPQVDVLITSSNEEDDSPPAGASYPPRTAKVRSIASRLIERRRYRQACINKARVSDARAMRRATVPINSPGANGFPRCGRPQNNGGNASRL
jgi:hypothetical protein